MAFTVQDNQSEKGKGSENLIMKKSAGQAISNRWNKEERDRILLERLLLVRYLACRMHVRMPRPMPFEDMVQVGVVSLIDALNKFDRSKRVQFGPYAEFRIRGEILDRLREMDWGPRELRRKGRLIEEAQHTLSLDLSRAPTENEMAANLNLELRKFQKLLSELDRLGVVSAHLQSSGDEEERDLCECLPDKSPETLSTACAPRWRVG
jgi:RNA polymerase sigma factor for flagellar operon FliA